MRILLVSTFYYPIIRGGAEVSTQIMAEGLVKKGHKVTVLTLAERNSVEEINGVKVERVCTVDSFLLFKKNISNGKIKKAYETYREFFYSPYYYGFYLEYLTKNRFDIVHASGNLFCMGRYNLWAACRKKKIPVSQALRDPKLCHLDFANGFLDNFLAQATQKKLHMLYGIVAPSNYMLNFYKTNGITHETSSVIYNAVDIEFKQSIPKNKNNTVLYVGRISKEKGVGTFVNTAKLLKKIDFIIVGEGDGLNDVSLPENLHLYGYMDRFEVYSLMQSSKVVVLPSEWPEAFGRTVIESIANGTLAIGSDSGALPEILSNSYNFETGNAEKLKESIEKILAYSDYEYLCEIEAQQKMCHKYTKDYYVTQWERFFMNQNDCHNLE